MEMNIREDDWVARLRFAGEEQQKALAELREFLLRGLRKAFLAKGANEAFCEDITQEALIRILDNLEQFAGRSRFTTWAMTIAVREAVSRFRRKQFQEVSLQEITGGEKLDIAFPNDASSSPQNNSEKQEILQTLRQLIEKDLTEKQRMVVQASLGGMPVEEIARRVDSNRNAIYKLIYDARQKLKQGMEQAGYTWPDIQAAFS